MASIPLVLAIQQVPGARRQDLVAAIKIGELVSSTPNPPYMVQLADVQAYVAARPVLPPGVITRSMFISRFTAAEKVAIASSPQFLVWWLQLLSDFPAIDLSNSQIIADTGDLVQGGAITADRAAAILTP